MAAVLLLSLMLALTSDVDQLSLALTVVLGVGAALVMIRNLTLGLSIFLAAGLILPIGLDTGTHTPLGINVILLAGLVIIWVLRFATIPKEILLPRSHTVLPLLALCAIAVLSFGIGLLPWFAFAKGAPLRAQLGGMSMFLFSAAAFLLAATQIRSLTSLRRFTWMFLAIAGAIAVNRLLGNPLGFIGSLTARGATGSMFWTWLVALAFAQAAFNDTLKRRWRLILILLVVAVFYLNLFQGRRWASGWIPAVVAIATMLVAARPRLGIVVVIVFGVFSLAGFAAVRDFVMIGDNPYSLLTRIEAWKILSEIIQVSPLLGLGPANYYWYSPLYPILGYYVEFSSHNNFIDLVAQTGIVGITAFVWFFIRLGETAWNTFRLQTHGFPRAYALGGIGGLVGSLSACLLGDWLIPFVYNVGMPGLRSSLIAWVFLGGLVALETISRSPEFDQGF